MIQQWLANLEPFTNLGTYKILTSTKQPEITLGPKYSKLYEIQYNRFHTDEIKNQKEDTKENIQAFKITFLLSQYIAASSTAVTEQVFRKYYSENHFGNHKSTQMVLR